METANWYDTATVEDGDRSECFGKSRPVHNERGQCVAVQFRNGKVRQLLEGESWSWNFDVKPLALGKPWLEPTRVMMGASIAVNDAWLKQRGVTPPFTPSSPHRHKHQP